MNNDAETPIVLGPGRGNPLNVLGDIVTIKIKSEETDGKYSVIETTIL